MVNARLKRSFFDRAAVIAALGKARANALSKIGAYLQRRARSSMRRRKKSSAPGTPPSAHSADPVATLKNIWFGYDDQTRSLVVGPVKINQVDFLNGQRGSGTVPQLQEFGGTRGVVEVQLRNGSWIRADQRSRRRLAGLPSRVRLARYPARPYMKPALDAEVAAGTLPAQWANSVKAA